MNTEDNEGKLCMQSEEMSSNESTMNLTSSPSTTQDTTSFSTTSHLGLNTNPSTWAIAIIATLLLLLLGETIICILLWIVCLKYQKLYSKATKCKIFTGHSTGANESCHLRVIIYIHIYIYIYISVSQFLKIV